MFRVLAVLAVIVAAATALAAWWDVLVPQPVTPVALQGSATRLQDRRVPGFSLPGLIGPDLSAGELINSRRPRVVKFWGPWSPACILEQPLLMELQASGVELWSIVFRDTRTNALDYLERNGNPYDRVALDAAGRVALDWGVKEVPATYLVDNTGVVRWYMPGR